MATSGIPIAMSLFGGGTSAFGAYSQNQATQRSMDAARRAAGVQIGQLDEGAALERSKAASTAKHVRSRLAVIQADSGFGADGSFETLDNQTYLDEQRNIQAIERNTYFQKARVASGLDADLASLAAHISNPLLSAITGAAGGFTTGLQIKGAIDEYKRGQEQG